MATNPGAALAALRHRVKHRCPICEKPFKGIATAKFCSNTCRQRNKRAK